MADILTTLIPGDRVRVERDETLYPPRGTWKNYRGKTGTVVEINKTRLETTGEWHTEVGVVFGATRRDPRTGTPRGGAATWFMPWELTEVNAR